MSHKHALLQGDREVGIDVEIEKVLAAPVVDLTFKGVVVVVVVVVVVLVVLAVVVGVV